jgi:hypothetical protein
MGTGCRQPHFAREVSTVIVRAVLPLGLAVLAFVPPLCATPPQFRIADKRLQVFASGEVVLQSPVEGLWSIACSWRDGWPADWHHAVPAQTLTQGEWTLLRGELNACGGVWQLEDAYRLESGVIRGLRRFTWKGAQPAKQVTLAVRFEAVADSAQPLLPGILYHGNPSGARSGRVPVSTGQPGEESIYEEHRYPMPFASLELKRGAKLWGAALHTVPSPAPYGNRPDQWWSLGVISTAGATELTLLSGPCASNGKRSVIKGVQRGFMPHADTWLNLEPAAVVEKSFYLEAFPVAREGSAFQQPVRTSIALFQPFFAADLPTIADIVRAKYRYAQTRWRETPDHAIFQKYVDRPQGVMGWTGQAEAPGYALQILAPGLKDPNALAYVQKSLDFLSSATFYDGGFHNWYDLNKKQWYGTEPLNQGQAMLSLARAIAVGRARGRQTAKWEAFLRRACDLHAARILAPGWRPRSTNEASILAPLVKASVLFKSARYRQAALATAQHYAERHLSMREPYWGGTSDASCEDKEGAALAFAGFLELYELTRSPEHLVWARHACDAMLTYTYVWDIPLPAGRLADHRVRTRGWTSVSAQNQHLDVWGALTAPDVYRLGQLDNREDLKRLALVMYRSAGQLIDPYGSQGEQLQQTNYAQLGRDVGLAEMRGGYHETWTVFWITAHFLTGAARFAELGVPVWE